MASCTELTPQAWASSFTRSTASESPIVPIALAVERPGRTVERESGAFRRRLFAAVLPTQETPASGL